MNKECKRKRKNNLKNHMKCCTKKHHREISFACKIFFFFFACKISSSFFEKMCVGYLENERKNHINLIEKGIKYSFSSCDMSNF